MRNSRAFVLGGIMGAAVVWLWGREMEAYLEERTRGARTKAAEGVRAVEETAEKVLDRGEHALRRADEFLQGGARRETRDSPPNRSDARGGAVVTR